VTLNLYLKVVNSFIFDWNKRKPISKWTDFNPLNAELNPICHLLALLEAHHILHISRIRVNRFKKTPFYNLTPSKIVKSTFCTQWAHNLIHTAENNMLRHMMHTLFTYRHQQSVVQINIRLSIYVLGRYMGERRCSSTHSWLQRQIEVSGLTSHFSCQGKSLPSSTHWIRDWVVPRSGLDTSEK